MRLGILTGGGDCPGLNAVIRAAVVRTLRTYDGEMIGFLDGWGGLPNNPGGRWRPRRGTPLPQAVDRRPARVRRRRHAGRRRAALRRRDPDRRHPEDDR